MLKAVAASLLLCLAFLPLAANAATITIDESKSLAVPVVKVSGPILQGDAAKFAKSADGLAQAIVYLSSDGGSTFDGIAIGRAIHQKKFATVVPSGKQCASSCGLIWIGGEVRYVEQGARVGFHASYIKKKGKALESGFGNALVGAYLNELGLSDQAIYYATVKPPSDIAWLTQSDASQLGIGAIFDKPPDNLKLVVIVRPHPKPTVPLTAEVQKTEPIVIPQAPDGKKQIYERISTEELPTITGSTKPMETQTLNRKLYYERAVGEKIISEGPELTADETFRLERMRMDVEMRPQSEQGVERESKVSFGIWPGQP